MLALAIGFTGPTCPVTTPYKVCTAVFRGHSGGGTPGPIPNPEVKPSSADGTARETVWESRSPRNLIVQPPDVRQPAARAALESG
jgi:hypothetical protein